MAKNKNRMSTEINASSMADIAFLLLIFFLVTTTMDIDKGILVKLPPMPEPDEPIIDVKLNNRNAFPILINGLDQIQAKGKLTDIKELKNKAKEFINNNGVNPDYSVSPDKAVISLKNDRATSYDIYIQVQNEIKAAYNELRNEYALKTYSVSFNDLPKDKQKEIRKEVYPIKLSEAEPENYNK